MMEEMMMNFSISCISAANLYLMKNRKYAIYYYLKLNFLRQHLNQYWDKIWSNILIFWGTILGYYLENITKKFWQSSNIVLVENLNIVWMELLTGTVPVNKLLLARTVPVNKLLLAGTTKKYNFQKNSPPSQSTP